MWCDGHPRTEMPAVKLSKMEAKRGDNQRSGHGHRRRHREQADKANTRVCQDVCVRLSARVTAQTWL
jgi:hypothetical protein